MAFIDDFIAAYEGTGSQNKKFRDNFQKMVFNGIRNALVDGSNPGPLGAALNEVAATADKSIAALGGDPGVLATLLYSRISDGVYEELTKWQAQYGFKPDPTVPPAKGEEA